MMEVTELIDKMRGVVRKNWDNVVLVSGVEGTGKSRLVLQIARAVDPSFSSNRIWFHREDFLACAKEAPRYGSVVWDEMLLSKRRTMSRNTVEVLDFLQVCRGLNLHLFLVTPHEDLTDAALTDYRVRWNLHVARRGVCKIRVRRRKSTPSGPKYWWDTVGAFTYKAGSGSLVDAYEEKKKRHMRGMDRVTGDESYMRGGLDVNAARGALVALGLEN